MQSFFLLLIFFKFDEVIIILSLTGVITKIKKNMKFKYRYILILIYSKIVETHNLNFVKCK